MESMAIFLMSLKRRNKNVCFSVCLTSFWKCQRMRLRSMTLLCTATLFRYLTDLRVLRDSISHFSVYLSVHRSVNRFVYPSVGWSVGPSVHRSVGNKTVLKAFLKRFYELHYFCLDEKKNCLSACLPDFFENADACNKGL